MGWQGIIYHTANAGITWQKQTSGANIDLKQVVFVDAEHGWAMGADMLVATTDGGQTWNSIGESKLSLQSIAFVDVQTGWGILWDEQHDSKLARTNDGGATWITQSTPTPPAGDFVLFLNKNEGWVSGHGIIHTSDRGQSWHSQRIPRADLSYERISFAGRKNGAAIHLGAMDTSRVGDVVRTRDGGLSWHVVSNSWLRPTTERVYREKFPGLTPGKH